MATKVQHRVLQAPHRLKRKPKKTNQISVFAKIVQLLSLLPLTASQKIYKITADDDADLVLE